VQPGFELAEIQMPLRAAQPIMDALIGRAAYLEVDAPTRGVEFNLGHLPRRHQTQRAREQRLNANAHAILDLINSIPPGGHVDKPLTRLAHMPTGPDYH
jgi:hypothetical protein